jgi:hypothetical protein
VMRPAPRFEELVLGLYPPRRLTRSRAAIANPNSGARGLGLCLWLVVLVGDRRTLAPSGWKLAQLPSDFAWQQPLAVSSNIRCVCDGDGEVGVGHATPTSWYRPRGGSGRTQAMGSFSDPTYSWGFAPTLEPDTQSASSTLIAWPKGKQVLPLPPPRCSVCLHKRSSGEPLSNLHTTPATKPDRQALKFHNGYQTRSCLPGSR